MALGRIVSFTSRNVFTNLAAEERIFERTSGHTLLFYVNRPCIVLGRTQNPFYEADITRALAEDVPIVRRRSGGGTVVHDEGNLNMCFIAPRNEHDTCFNAKLVASTLRDDFGISAEVSKRGDIHVNGLKVSGSAYRISRDRAYHHATLLVRSDLPRLRALLASPLRPHMEISGTKSVRAEVANISSFGDGDVEIPDIIDAIAARWRRGQSDRVKHISPSKLERELGGLERERGNLSAPEWVYGQTPSFKFKVENDPPASAVNLHMRKGGIIERVEISHEDEQVGIETPAALGDLLSNALVGLTFNGTQMDASLKKVERSADLKGDDLLAFKRVCATLQQVPTPGDEPEEGDAETD